MKLKIKTGDTVRVISGESKGLDGKIIKVLPTKNKAIVEGVNLVSRHTKPSAKDPKGGILKKEAPLHISNLMLLEDGEVTRVGYKMEGDKKIRYSKKTSKEI